MSRFVNNPCKSRFFSCIFCFGNHSVWSRFFEKWIWKTSSFYAIKNILLYLNFCWDCYFSSETKQKPLTSEWNVLWWVNGFCVVRVVFTFYLLANSGVSISISISIYLYLFLLNTLFNIIYFRAHEVKWLYKIRTRNWYWQEVRCCWWDWSF